MITVGEVELGDAGYLMSLTSRSEVVKVHGNKVEILNKKEVYIKKIEMFIKNY